VDAVDTVTAKLELVCRATALGVPIISSMGAANKLNPAALEVADIYQTSVCPLARVMRAELRKRKVEKLKVVYSKEPAMKPLEGMAGLCGDDAGASLCDPAEKPTRRRQIPASNSFVPPVAGLIMAGEVVKDLVGFQP
jgi:tRNA A37 threonylcarbamoyladenosine dehydratase